MAAAGLQLLIGPVIGAATAIANDMRAYQPGAGNLDVRAMVNVLTTVQFPSDEQVVLILPVDRKAALALLRGTYHMQQVLRSVELLVIMSQVEAARSQAAALLPIVDQALGELTEAKGRLGRFLSIVE